MEFPCVNCGRTLSAQERFIGKNIVCYHCGHGNRIPEIAPLQLNELSWEHLLANLRCPTCGYALNGLLENRCPECGKRFNPVSLLRAGDGRYARKDRFVLGFLVGMGVTLVIIALFMCAGA